MVFVSLFDGLVESCCCYSLWRIVDCFFFLNLQLLLLLNLLPFVTPLTHIPHTHTHTRYHEQRRSHFCLIIILCLVSFVCVCVCSTVVADATAAAAAAAAITVDKLKI